MKFSNQVAMFQIRSLHLKLNCLPSVLKLQLKSQSRLAFSLYW